MSMRSLKRSVARYRMKAAGISHVNKALSKYWREVLEGKRIRPGRYKRNNKRRMIG